MSWTTAYETQAPSSDISSSNFGTFPIRVVVAKTRILATGNHARFIIPGTALGNTNEILVAWVGFGSAPGGDAADFSEPPQQLSFAGLPGATAGVGDFITSDAVAMDIDGTKDVILSYRYSGDIGCGVGFPDCDSWAYNVGSVSDMDIGGLFNINDIFGGDLSYGLFKIEVDTYTDSPEPASPPRPFPSRVH